MRFVSSPYIDTWESVATANLLQSYARLHGNNGFFVENAGQDLKQLLPEQWLIPNSSVETTTFQYPIAYRQTDTSQMPYMIVLAEASHVPFSTTTFLDKRISDIYRAFDMPDIMPCDDNFIILAPYALKKDLELPEQCWPHILRVLQSYGKVYLLGNSGERLDQGRLTECQILSELPLRQKMYMIARASLIVGSANAWTWLAPAWKKPSVIMYPDSIPHDRWFPQYYEHDKLRRLHYPVNQIQTPTILAGMRRLINEL